MNQFVPAEVISYFDSDGMVKPLKIRVISNNAEPFCGKVQRILKSTEQTEYGAEARAFHCSVESTGREVMMEIKFLYRRHIWVVSGIANQHLF